jgi:DNA-binding GntR family transcriptional regulator
MVDTIGILNAGIDAAGSASTRAYRLLEKMIVTLELAPGQVTTERTLIDRLALGRTPVREAIQRLSWEGLISVRPRAGLEIAPLRAADWLRVLEARRGVEIVLARSAARHLTAETAASFRATAMAMHEAVLSDDVLGFLEADKSLDEALTSAADNDFAARVAAPLQTHSRRFWYRFQSGTGLAESAGNHVALIQAILERDEERAGEEADRLMSLLRLHAQAAAMRLHEGRRCDRRRGRGSSLGHSGQGHGALPAFAGREHATLSGCVGGEDCPGALVGDKDFQDHLRIDHAYRGGRLMNLVAKRLDHVGAGGTLLGSHCLGHWQRRRAQRHGRKEPFHYPTPRARRSRPAPFADGLPRLLRAGMPVKTQAGARVPSRRCLATAQEEGPDKARPLEDIYGVIRRLVSSSSAWRTRRPLSPQRAIGR